MRSSLKMNERMTNLSRFARHNNNSKTYSSSLSFDVQAGACSSCSLMIGECKSLFYGMCGIWAVATDDDSTIVWLPKKGALVLVDRASYRVLIFLYVVYALSEFRVFLTYRYSDASE
jgi:Fe-S cluster assembly iron-binding protein IscA